jgi:hypothetical protein
MRGRPSGSTDWPEAPFIAGPGCFLLEGLQVRADAFVEREWRARDLRDIQLGVWRFRELEVLAGRRCFADPPEEEVAARGRYEQEVNGIRLR